MNSNKLLQAIFNLPAWLLTSAAVCILLIWLPYSSYTLTSFGILTVAYLLLYSLKRHQTQRQVDSQLAHGYTLLLRPREDAGDGVRTAPAFWNPAADRIPAVNIFRSLPVLHRLKRMQSQHIAWHLAGNGQQEAFYLTTAWSSTAQTLLNQLAATWPGLQSVVCDAEQRPQSRAVSAEFAHTIYLQPRNWTLPITTTTSEPLTAFMLRLNRLAANRFAGMTLLLRPASKKIRRQLRDAVRSAEETKQRDQVKLLKQRTHGAWFEAVIYVHAAAPTKQAASSAARQLAADLCAVVDPDNPLQTVSERSQPLTLAWNKRRAIPLHESDVSLLAHLIGRDAVAQGIALETAAAIVCYPEPACYVERQQTAFRHGEQRLIGAATPHD